MNRKKRSSPIQSIALAVALSAMCASSIAIAGRRVLVLKADGNASVEIKVRVDAQVLRLAKALDASVESGEVTFGDASTAVGCSGSEAQCRGEVMNTLAVDEVVSVAVTSLPNGDIRVSVHRIGKTGPIRETEALVPAGQSIDARVAAGVGPLFGAKPKPTAEPNPSPPMEYGRTPPPRTEETPSSAFGGPAPTAVEIPPFEHSPPPAQPQPQPRDSSPSGGPTNGRAIAGMAIGGGLITLAVVLWSGASGVQTEINQAATSSPADFKHLQDLESKGDAYANFGNAFFIGGAVVAGVSTYFFLKDRLRPSRHARIAPTVFDHGAGIALMVLE